MKTIQQPRGNAEGRGEAELIAGLAQGDPEVTAEFMQRTHEAVYALTARLTLDPDLRHDWTGDILLRIVSELRRGRFVYRWPGCLWSWFQKRSYYMLLNIHRSHRQRNDRWTTGELGQELTDRFAGATYPDGQKMLEDVEARRVVEACLAKLPSDDQRRALSQVLFEGMSYQEVADDSGAALNTVRSWIRRSRLAVRKCVAASYGLGP